MVLDKDEMCRILFDYWDDHEDIEDFMFDHFQNLETYEKNLENFKEIYEV